MLVTAVSMTENVIFNGQMQMSRTIDTPLVGVNASHSLGFERPIPPNGYAWWYCDALSDDGGYGLTIIAMLGSVFSPHYFRARAHGDADPLAHCAINAVLYGRAGRHWSMTEYGRSAVQIAAKRLAIGASDITQHDESIVIRIDELTAPWRRRMRGVIHVRPTGWGTTDFALDATRTHRWWPIAPQCDVDVQFNAPAVRWSGRGYFDSNWGAHPLERDFVSWNWSRISAGDETVVFYDVAPRASAPVGLALAVARDGRARAIESPPVVRLPNTAWGMQRHLRSEHAHAAHVVQTLESAPFYARSAVTTQVFGQSASGMHESLSLDRFRSAWVQMLLPVRAPRAQR
jgi:carotenoid 1,2-hydratase